MDHCKQWTVKCLRWGRFSLIVYHILQQPLPDNTEQISIIKTWSKLFQRLFNVIRVNFQNVQIVTKEMSPTSKPQTWNTVVSRPLHQNETEPPRRYDAVPLHGYTEKWHYTQNKKISNFISSFWHCEFILTCQTLFHLWSAPWLSNEYSHPECLCTQ